MRLDPALLKEFKRPAAGKPSPILVGWATDTGVSSGEAPRFTLDSIDRRLFDPTTFEYARFLPSMIVGQPVARVLLPEACLIDRRDQRAVPTLAAGAALVAEKGSLAVLDPFSQAVGAEFSGTAPLRPVARSGGFPDIRDHGAGILRRAGP